MVSKAELKEEMYQLHWERRWELERERSWTLDNIHIAAASLALLAQHPWQARLLLDALRERLDEHVTLLQEAKDELTEALSAASPQDGSAE